MARRHATHVLDMDALACCRMTADHHGAWSTTGAPPRPHAGRDDHFRRHPGAATASSSAACCWLRAWWRRADGRRRGAARLARPLSTQQAHGSRSTGGDAVRDGLLPLAASMASGGRAIVTLTVVSGAARRRLTHVIRCAGDRAGGPRRLGGPRVRILRDRRVRRRPVGPEPVTVGRRRGVPGCGPAAADDPPARGRSPSRAIAACSARQRGRTAHRGARQGASLDHARGGTGRRA
jgi:hypothetical protein